MNFIDYLTAYALAVSEQNAEGGWIVTAPTNGAAGVVPAVLKFIKTFYQNKVKKDFHRDYLLVASAIGILVKQRASISGAEGGC